MEKYLYYISIIIPIFFFSCKEKESPIILQVYESNSLKDVHKDDVIIFEINAFSNTSNLHKFSIYEKSFDNGSVKIFDTILNDKDFKFDYSYIVGDFSLNQNVTLLFTVEDMNGEKYSTDKTYNFIFTDTPLQELSSFSMYTTLSEKPDGFTLSTNSLIYINSITDTSLIDIYSYQDSISNLNYELKREWRSKSGLSFIRYKDFNYQEATAQSLKNAYRSGNKLMSINKILNDDIILIGKGDNPIGAIKIIGVFDQDGIVNDRYVFSLKLIK